MKRTDTWLFGLLFAAALAWWIAALMGIVHWSYHAQTDPEFFSLSQIKKSFFVVSVLYAASGLAIALIFESWTHGRSFSGKRKIALTTLAVVLMATTIGAFPSAPPCGEAKRRMNHTGVAYDAREQGLFGHVKKDEPSGDRFSPDAKQLAWWGTFNKPFEYWGSPDLTAEWFDPEGQKVASIKVDTDRCKLATARFKQNGFKPGIWHVNVNCRDGSTLDHKEFAVGRPPAIPSDVQVVGQGEQRISIDVS